MVQISKTNRSYHRQLVTWIGSGFLKIPKFIEVFKKTFLKYYEMSWRKFITIYVRKLKCHFLIFSWSCDILEMKNAFVFIGTDSYKKNKFWKNFGGLPLKFLKNKIEKHFKKIKNRVRGRGFVSSKYQNPSLGRKLN